MTPEVPSDDESPTFRDDEPDPEHARKALLLVGRMKKEGLLQPKSPRYPSLRQEGRKQVVYPPLAVKSVRPLEPDPRSEGRSSVRK